VDAFMCYKQKCKVVSLNLAHPVYFIVMIMPGKTGSYLQKK